MLYVALNNDILTFVYAAAVNNELDRKEVCHIPFKSSKEYNIIDQEKNFLKGDL